MQLRNFMFPFNHLSLCLHPTRGIAVIIFRFWRPVSIFTYVSPGNSGTLTFSGSASLLNA